MLRNSHVGLPTGALVLFVALCVPIAGDAGSRPVAADWTRSASGEGWSSLCDHAMAYVGEDKVLLYQGTDTWVYDLSQDSWALHPLPGPSSRANHMMAPLGADQVLLFGGPNITPDDETWVYSLSEDAWTQRFPPVSPAARFDQAMAFIRNGQALLFGGHPGNDPFSTALDDTWLFDVKSGTWIEKLPPTRPSPRYEHAMAPIGLNRVIVFGGHDPILGPTGTTPGSTTSRRTRGCRCSLPTAPPPRRNHALAYIGGDQVLLFGGYVFSGDYWAADDTWVYDLSDNAWTLQAPRTIPTPQACHAMASIANGKALMLGDGTWIYSARTNPNAP